MADTKLVKVDGKTIRVPIDATGDEIDAALRGDEPMVRPPTAFELLSGGKPEPAQGSLTDALEHAAFPKSVLDFVSLVPQVPGKAIAGAVKGYGSALMDAIQQSPTLRGVPAAMLKILVKDATAAPKVAGLDRFMPNVSATGGSVSGSAPGQAIPGMGPIIDRFMPNVSATGGASASVAPEMASAPASSGTTQQAAMDLIQQLLQTASFAKLPKP